MKITLTLSGSNVLRWLLAMLFIWAAISKLANPTAMLGNIYDYALPLPDVLLRLAAMVLPWVELLCGLLLLANLWIQSVLLLLLGIFTLFLAVTGQAWLRHLDIACGCFNLSILGINASSKAALFLESVKFAFLRNIVLLGCCGYLFVRTREGDAPAEP